MSSGVSEIYQRGTKKKKLFSLDSLFIVFVLCKLEDIKLQLEEVVVALEGFLVGFNYVGK